jgi:aspartate aminotransferase-like enzyme
VTSRPGRHCRVQPVLATQFALADGYGDLKGKTFRIAHMGEIQMTDLENLLAAMDEYNATKGI